MEPEIQNDLTSQNTDDELSQTNQSEKTSQKEPETFSAYEIGKMVLRSEALTKDIQKTKQVPKIYTTEQVKELDDVSMIQALQQKQRELYENVNVGSNIDNVLKYQQENLKKIQPGNLAKLVGQTVVAQDINKQTAVHEEIHDEYPQESAELQTEAGSEHDTTKLDMDGSGGESQDQRTFKASDFMRMHEAQQEVLSKLPIVDHQTNNFAPKSENKEGAAQNQLLKEYLQTFPSSIVTHINDYQEFKRMVRNGSLLNYYDMETIVQLIQNKLSESEQIDQRLSNQLNFGASSDFKMKYLEHSSVKTDIYGKLYRQLKQKFGHPFIYDKDNVRRSSDYQINDQIDEKEALQLLESPDGFKPPDNTTIVVDELAAIAKRYGDSYGAYLNRIEDDLQFRRQCALGILHGHKTYEKAMKKRAAELSTEAESQILKMSIQRDDPPIEYEMEMRLQDMPDSHVGFLEDVLLKYINDEAEQTEDVRKKLALQALQSQYDQKLFRSPNEYLEYISGPVLDEDLVELNVSFDPDPPLQPVLNPDFEYFITEKGEQKHTQASKRIARFFQNQKIPIGKQLELFEVAAENLDKIEQIGENLKEINEGTDEQAKNAAYIWFLKYLNVDISEWIKAAEQQAQEDAIRNSKMTMSNRLGTQLLLDVSTTNLFGSIGTPKEADSSQQ